MSIQAGLAGIKGRENLSKERLDMIFGIAIKWSLYAIVFAAPFSKSIAEAGMAVAIAVWAAGRLVNRDLKPVKMGLGIALAVFVVTMLPSFLNTAYPSLSVKAFFTKVLKYVFLCVVMADTIRTKELLLLPARTRYPSDRNFHADNHAEAVVLFADKMLKINRGGSTETPGIRVYTIYNHDSKEIIDAIQPI